MPTKDSPRGARSQRANSRRESFPSPEGESHESRKLAMRFSPKQIATANYFIYSSLVSLPKRHPPTLPIFHNRFKLQILLSSCVPRVSRCINITAVLWLAAAELVMKCNASIRHHSELPAQHSCSSAFMQDPVIRKGTALFKALNAAAAAAAAIADFIVPLLKQMSLSVS